MGKKGQGKSGKEGEGREGKGREGRKEGVSSPNKNPGYGPGLTALLEKLRLLQIRVAHFCITSSRSAAAATAASFNPAQLRCRLDTRYVITNVVV